MIKYIFRRALSQWKLLSLLWLSVLIASTFIISAPSYLDWIKGMIYQDALAKVPSSTKNITITTGSQPLIKEAFLNNNQIVKDVSHAHLNDLVRGINSALKSTEYYWGFEAPDKSRTASLLSFTSFNSVDKFVLFPNNKNKLLSENNNTLYAYGPKSRLERLGLEIGDIINVDSVKGGPNNNASLLEAKNDLKDFIKKQIKGGWSLEDIFVESPESAYIQGVKSALEKYNISSVNELVLFLESDEDQIDSYDLAVQIIGYFEEIPENDLFNYYEEVFLPPSSCMTCQPPLVLTIDQEDFFNYLVPLTKGLPIRAWWYLDINDQNFVEDVNRDYLGIFDDYEKNMLVSFPQASVLTQLDSVAENTKKEMNFVSAPVLVIFSLLVVFSSILLIMFSYLINQQRREEVNYLVLRGASRIGIIRYFFLEWIFLGFPVIILAPILSNFILKLVISTFVDNQSLGQNWLQPEFNWSSYIISLITVLSTIAISFFIYLSLNAQLINSKKIFLIVNKNSPNFFSKYFLDIFFAIAAILTFFEFKVRVSTYDPSGEDLSTFVFFILPLALMTFLSLLFVRLFPILLKLISLFGKFSVVSIYLSSKRLTNNSGWYLWLFLVVSVGITAFMIISGTQSSLEKSKKEKSSFITVSDFRVTASSPFGIEREAIENLEALEGVNVVGRMSNLIGNIGTTGSGVDAQLLASDKNLIDIAWTREDFFDLPKQEIFSKWSQEDFVDGILINDNINEIEIKSHSDMDREDSFLWAVIKGSDGRISALSLGGIKSEKWSVNKVELKNIKTPAHIVGIEIFEPSSEDNSQPFVLNFSSIALKDKDNDLISEYKFSDNLEWMALPTSEGFDTKIVFEKDSITLNLGSGSTKGIRGIFLSSNKNGLPVVVNEKFLEESGKSVGDNFIFYASGSYIPMVIENKINYFPGSSDDYDALILMDFNLLKNYMELTKLQSFKPNELVIETNSELHNSVAEYLDSNFALSTIRNKFLIEEKSLVTQIAVASWSGISIIALWTFLFLICLGSFGFYLANEIEAVSENAIGGALGISTSSKFIMTYYEYGIVVLAGILSGVISGISISRILNKLVMSLDESTQTNFPETLIISWVNVIYLVSSILILYIASSFLFSLITTRTNISEEIKKESLNVN